MWSSLKNPQYGQFRRVFFFTSWGGVQTVISKAKVRVNQGYSRPDKFLVCKVGTCEFLYLPLRFGLHFLEVQSQHVKYSDRQYPCTLVWGGEEKHLSWFMGTPLKPRGRSLKIQDFKILLTYWTSKIEIVFVLI